MAKANVVVLLDANLHDPSTPLQMKHSPHGISILIRVGFMGQKRLVSVFRVLHWNMVLLP